MQPSKRLDHPATKLALIRELAAELSAGSLAEKYGCDDQTITAFARKYAIEIATQRTAGVEDVFAPLWATEKANRVAMYEQDIDLLDNEQVRTGIVDEKLMRTKHAALRAVADEMGQLPQRIVAKVEVDQVRHVIEGVDLDALS